MTEETAKTPEWMLLLENKKKRPHRLAHEIGAGAPCLSCGDSCPGLDLHFWRKLCRNCKCKKEEHDVKDDEGYEQFEILFANSGVGKKKKTGAFLNIKVPEATVSTTSSTGSVSSSSTTSGAKKGVAFDWVPPDVPEDVAAEYMQQLPPSKLPISGSDGALYRRQQLESQIPLHDLDASKCHGLSADEIQGLQQYLDNLKNNVVGQGRVTKIPALYSEQRLPYSGPTRHQSVTVAHASVTGESRPLRIATSQSAQCLKSLPSIPLPRPFSTHHYDKDDPNNFPPPPPNMLPSTGGTMSLKTPSAFLPSHLHAQHPSEPIDAHLVADQQASDLSYSSQIPSGKAHSATTFIPAHGATSTDRYRQDTQHSVPVAGKYYDPATGQHGVPMSEAGNQYMNVSKSSGQMGDVTPLTHARDGTFVSDQQAHDIAFSTQVPIGQASQQSKTLNIPKGVSDTLLRENQQESSSGDNPYSREGIISASRLPGMQRNIKDSQQFHGEHPLDGKFCSTQNPKDVSFSTTAPVGSAQYASVYQGSNSGTVFPQDGTLSTSQFPSNIAHSSTVPGQKLSVQSNPSHISLGNASYGDDSVPQLTNEVLAYPNTNSSQDAKFVPYSANVPGQVIYSAPIAGDSMPKSAHVLHQSHLVQQEEWEPDALENELSGKLEQLVGLGENLLQPEEYHLNCHKCQDVLLSGQVAVLAERAGKQAAWHPQCFVCCTCEELLVDLIYFYHKGDVYCGRHYAELLNIPRCFACDELIFVKEYTCAEGKAFHVKHFCCYECDVPLGGKQYIPKDNQPVCLQCFENIYGKSCHTCKKKIAAGDQRVGWKDISWHVSPSCFCCAQCLKSLLGGKFLVKNEQPFCSKECAQAAINNN